MNAADTELVVGILDKAGYDQTSELERADVVLVNTCAVRENAEQRVIGRLGDFRHYKKQNPGVVVGVLGCMAERLRRDLIESEDHVDLVVGPDEYRRLPEMIESAMHGEKGIAVRLSRVETYDDITPVREDGVNAWISVMRGCDKFCSFCVVPFTRGRERSRPMAGVLEEARGLIERGFREVTLLGQNVNSYFDEKQKCDFATLLEQVALLDSTLRVRFTTSHPQDMSERLIEVIAKHKNICNYIHLPVQSGSDRILEAMNRNYSADHYRNLVQKIRETIRGVSLSTDIIAGYPTETEDDHKQTIQLLEEIEFDGAFTFKYSPRENTKAWHLKDDVTEETKSERLNEVIDVQRAISFKKNNEEIGRNYQILVEGESRKSSNDWCGRTDTNKMVIFPRNGTTVGTYLDIQIERANSATLFGKPVKEGKSSPSVEFAILKG